MFWISFEFIKWLLAITIGLHIAFKGVIYFCFGLQFSYINPFSLSIHNLKYVTNCTNEFNVTIGKIKLHLSLLRREEAYVKVTLSDVAIGLQNLDLNGADATNPQPSPDPQADAKKTDFEDYMFDPDASVSIYSKNKRLRRLTVFLIRYWPHLSFKVSNTRINVTSDLKIVVEKITGKTDISKLNAKTSFINKKSPSHHRWISALQLEKSYLANQSSNEVLSNFFDKCLVSMELDLDLKKGIITSFEPRIGLSGINISVLYVLKLIKSLNPAFKLKEYSDTDDFPSSPVTHTSNDSAGFIPKKKLYIYGFVYRVLKNANYTVHSLTLTDIPITSTSNINKFLMDQTDSSLNGVLFSSVIIDSWSLNVNPISPSEAGFSLNFVQGSYPLQWIITLANCKIVLDYSKIEHYTGSTKQITVFSVPNILLTMKSTMMVNLLRVVFNNNDQTNFVQKQTITIIQLTIANPFFDVSIEQLTILINSLKNLKQSFSKTKKKTSVSANSTNQEPSWKKRYRNIFLDTLPKFQIKILIEKPIAMLKSNSIDENAGDLHMFVFQPSLAGLQLDFVTVGRSIDVSLRADVPETSLVYQKNNSNQSSVEVAMIRDVSLKASFQILELNNFKFSVQLSHLFVDLTNIELLNGLAIIVSLLKSSMGRNFTFSKRVEDLEKKTINPNSLFNELPEWFSLLSISLGDMKIKIGSKSLFIPLNELIDVNDNINDYENGQPLAPSSIVYRIGTMDFKLVQNTQEVESDDNMSSLNSENSKKTDEYFWTLQSNIHNIHIITHIKNPYLNTKTSEKILSVPNIKSNLYCLRTNIYELSNMIESINVKHSVTAHFIMFSSFSLLKNVFTYHKKIIFPDNERRTSDDSLKNHTTKERSAKFLLFNLKWHIKEIQFKMLMPGPFHLRLDVCDFKGLASNNTIILENKLIRLSVKKDVGYNFFSKLMSIDNMKMICMLPSKAHKLMKLTIYDNNIKISVPSNFVVHSLFDAIVLTLKLTKKFMHSVKTGEVTGSDTISSSGILKIPPINIKSDSLSFVTEDDPFEAELGMIYQLGLIENKNRIEKLKCFNNYVEKIKNGLEILIGNEKNDDLIAFTTCLDSIYSLTPIPDFNFNDKRIKRVLIECVKKLHKLRVNISKSWIRIVEDFKLQRRNTINMNMKFLAGGLASTLSVSSTFNSEIVDFNDLPPLMSLLFNDLNLYIKPPKFETDSGNVHKFLYRVGKGVPIDTNWDKIIPMRLTIKASEVRVHLRDFPLPMVYIPNKKSGERWTDSFKFNSTVVIAEPMPMSERQYWYIYIPMFSNMEDATELHHYYSWNAPKTVTTVKTYYEIDCDINSDNATMVTWSTGYQAVLRQLTIVFDTFSKLTKDPSPKLGVWDKLRNIMHGYAKFRWRGDDSEVRINILNSFDPYKLLTVNAGFSLVFKNNIEWLINDPLREHERDYFIFRSRTVLFGIPNYLAEPLPCWCSRELIFLPLKPEETMLTSMYGYYLNVDAYYDGGSKSKNILDITKSSRLKTINIFLNGEVEIKISMLFEKKLSDNTRTTKFKPHFENVLTAPQFIENPETFDSYKGFRSDYVHMALNLKAKKSSYNILRLSPRAIFQFLKWFKRFSNDPSLPIRMGSVWNSKKKSVSLGTHLMTFKFMFDVEPLYIYHGYRVDLASPENQTAIGLKGKIQSFKCDLHQRKENKIKRVDFLDKSYHVKKMAFYVGKIDLDDIDLRLVGLKYSCAKAEDLPEHKFEIFDYDQDWVDIYDFEEVDLNSLETYDIQGQILPLLYASHFCYWMNKNVTKNEFGNEISHDCLIDLEKYPNRSFHHIFDVDDLKLKWYCNARNILWEYIAELEFRSAYIYTLLYKARRAISRKFEDLGTTEISPDDDSMPVTPEFNISNAEEFENVIRSVDGFIENIVPVDHMLVRLNDVQAQIMIDPDDDRMILFRTQSNEIEIISLMDDNWFQSVTSNNMAKRYGTIFQDADLMILTQKDYEMLNMTTRHYGTNSSWPAFLTGQEPTEFIEERTILSDILMYFVFEKSSSAYSTKKSRNKLYLTIPLFKTKIDSESYLTFLHVIRKVLIYASPQQKRFAQTIQAISLATNDEDKSQMFQQLENVCGDVQKFVSLYQSLIPFKNISKEVAASTEIIHTYVSKSFANALILARVILLSINPKTQNSSDNCFMEWVIAADNIDIEFAENGNSFLNFTLNDGRFSRLEMLDKSTINEISIKTIKVLNKDRNILFPELLTSFTPDSSCCGVNIPQSDEMLDVKWEIGEKVGGMHNIKYVQLSSHPMKLSLEDKTGIKLMHFLFPDENKGNNSDSDSDSSSDSLIYNEEDDNESESSNSDTDIMDRISERKIVSLTDSSDNSNKAKEDVQDVPLINIEEPEPGNTLNNHSKTAFFSPEEELEDPNGARAASKNQKIDDQASTGSGLSATSNTKSLISSSYSKRLNKKIVGGNILNATSIIEHLTKGASNNSIQISTKQNNLMEMSDRAKKYFSIGAFEIERLILNITFAGKGKLRLINVNDFTFTVPKILIRKKVWRMIDMVKAIKKHILLTLLKQTGSLLKNKLFVHRRRKRMNKVKKNVK